MNNRNPAQFFTVLCLASMGLAAIGQTSKPALPSPAKAASAARAVVDYGKLPLSFEPNLGQTSDKVQWLARGPQYTLYLAGDDAVLQMNKTVPVEAGSSDPEKLKPTISSSAVRMSLLGAKASHQKIGEDLQSGHANYFTGNDPAKWQRDVPMYGKVDMRSVYPGVDLVYYGHQGQLEYDFVVAPGADASPIKMRFDGATPTLAVNGDLVLPVEGGPEVRFNKPVVYQMKDGTRQPVEGSFYIAGVGQEQQVSFKLGNYDHSRELVIDPTLTFVGIFGTGSYETQAAGMAVDALGEIILTGQTGDIDMPVTTGAYQTVCNQYSSVATSNHYVRCGSSQSGSAFVTKISADGTSLVYSTYLHGFSGQEWGEDVAADASGDAIVLGATGSSDFPITGDAIQTLCMPFYPMKGVSGGSPSDFYPITENCDGYNSSNEWYSGGPTLFIAKLNPAGSALIYSTFFGGSNPTYPVALALDSADNIYFTSYLNGSEQYLVSGVPFNNWYPQSSTVPFPYTGSAYQIANLAQQATTLSELSADGHTMLYSTIFDATNNSNPALVQPLALAVGPEGIAYVGGQTTSDAVHTTSGSVRPTCVDSSVYNGGYENGNCEAYTGWLAAFDTTQSGSASLKYATYIGGPETQGGTENQVLGLAADSTNNVYVTGMTISPTYPTTAGAYSDTCTDFRPTSGYCNNTAFLTKINPEGSAYVWSTYFGGNNQSSSQGQAIGFDAKGRVYLYGANNNYTYDLPVVNPLEPGPGNASSYAFVATFTPDGSKLLFATPLGNQSPNGADVYPVPNNGMVLDSEGNIYFSAYGGDNGTFITTSGAYATAALGASPRTYFGKISPVRDPTTISLIISPTNPAVGQTITFTATVAGSAVTTPTPTGTVALVNTATDSPTTLATITLGASGSGKFTTSSLALGSYTIAASYSGDTNYEVSTSAVQNLSVATAAPATLTTPAPGSVLAGSSVTFAWSAGVGTTEYALYLGSTGAGSSNLYVQSGTTAMSQAVTGLPSNGEKIYARLFSKINGAWQSKDYTYTAAELAMMTSPTPGSTLSGTSETFTWTSIPGNTGYWLFLGTTGVGSKDLLDSGQTAATSATFSGLPTNGATIYARVYTRLNGVLVYNDYTYKAAAQAVLTSPTPSSTLAGTSATFTWTAATGSGNQGYWLFLGTTGVGSKNLYDSGQQTATSVTASNLPTDGATIYARVYTRYNGVLVFNDYTYISWMKPPVLTTPTPGSTLAGSSVTFTWTAEAGSQGYWLFLGTTGAGSKNLYDSGQQAATSATFSGLPTDGATIYARVYTRYNGVLVYSDYTYKAE